MSARELLSAWEQGVSRPSRRALDLLGAAWPEMPLETLARISIGQRDRMLLVLRKQTFGADVTGLTTCQGCGQHIELTFNTDEIITEPRAETVQSCLYNYGTYEIQLRPLNTEDLAGIKYLPDVQTARRELLERCVVSVRHDGERVSVDELPPEVVDGISSQLDQVDPQANVYVGVSCPQCGHESEAVLDVETFVWAEVHSWARRTLHEVHQLASAYGWSEADILGMSAWRRHCYLSLAGR